MMMFCDKEDWVRVTWMNTVSKHVFQVSELEEAQLWKRLFAPR